MILSVRQEEMLYKKKDSPYKLTLLIARRLVGTLTRQQQLSRLTRICFLSSAIIACAFTVALAIMNGFQETTSAVFQNIHADIIIQAPEHRRLAVDKITKYLDTEFHQSIAAYAPYSEGYAIARAKNKQTLNHVVYIQGIDPKKDIATRALWQTVISPHSSFVNLFKKSGVVIGQMLATDLGVKIGETITLLFVSDEQSPDEEIRLEQIKIPVRGICKTGIDDLDTTIIIGDLKTFSHLFPTKGVTSIGLKLARRNGYNKETIATLRKRFDSLDVFHWTELYPALAAAFRLENIALIIIAFLICLIASTNLMSLLLLFITTKQQMIATLRAMGTPLKKIKRAFMLVGNGLVCLATIIGTLCGILICFFIEKYHLISLPDAYYVSHIPAKITIPIIILGCLLNILCGIIATWWATRTITQLPLSSTLKGESL